jgi:single-strand DNA-binding protein
VSRSLNRAEILGNLGSDPEVRSTSSGTKVATLSVATNRRWTDRQGNEKSKTEWHRVVAWNGLAGVCEKFLSKGDRIYVDGRIEYRSWEDANGLTRHATEIRADQLIMLGEGHVAPRTSEADFSDDALMGSGTTDDIPF